jgi:hypothetical protein
MADELHTVRDLIARYQHNADLYRRPAYNEAQVRTEFIDPLFVALGWDVHNREGRSPRYRDVIHEASLRQGGSVKAPDYAFCVGPERKFFVEAKKPAVDIASDPAPAYQLRRYAWTAKLPLSILTNFRQMAVYDCRVRPKAGDDAATARVLSLAYDQYAERWDEIANVFSRDAVWGGDFDRYAESEARKRGTQTVDEAFLAEIEGWRVALARNIALRNRGLSLRELNFSVQQTIDRLIFLRITEDRGIEPYGQLRNELAGAGVYARLVQLFQRADDRYNSGLFHFGREAGRENPDLLTPGLTIDDKVLTQIIGTLYYPECPYAFEALGADILGSIYERYLGSVVRLTPAGRAVVEQKPEVRKAGGVYYTPRYIVDYIVEHTVGALVNGKSPGQIADLRVLDPACGSGSFLLGAYQYLLDWHLEWYTAHPTARPRRELYQGAGGEWFLTTEEKKRILLAHIYGVDIDPQAVEVTKLSLLLKVLEGESAETLAAQREMWQERALPDLATNCKCGNSLIGPAFYHGQQGSMFDDDEFYRINAFDWEAAFPETMGRGGFDAVIGNPPYGAIFDTDEKQYLKSHFESIVGKYDSYGFFIERGLSLLLDGGRLGYIIPHTWLTIVEAQTLRSLILSTARIERIVRLPSRVFADATVDTVLAFLERCCDAEIRESNTITALLFARDAELQALAPDNASIHTYCQVDWSSAEACMFTIDVSADEQGILDRLRANHPKLQEICDFSVGVQAYDTHTGQPRSVIDSRAYHADQKRDETYRPELNGKDVSRYSYQWPGKRWISYGPWLAHPRHPRFFEGDRILVREITSAGQYAIEATYVEDPFVNYKTILNVVLTDAAREKGYDTRFVVGILSSRLLSWFFPRASNKLVTKTFPRISILDMKRFPIRTIDWDDPADVARHDRMVALVQQMLEQHGRLAAAATPRDREMIQRRIAMLDEQIDGLVYELYGLTEEERGVIT